LPPDKQSPSALTVSSEDGQRFFKLGGIIRLNDRYERWDSSPNHSRRLLFDTFRVKAQGRWDNFNLNATYIFQDRNRRSVEQAYIGYRFSDDSELQVGAPYKPFGLYPYNSFGWSFQIQNYMGFTDSAGLGFKYVAKKGPWDIQLAFFPEMLPAELRFTPEAGTYSDFKRNVFASNSQQANRKKNQVNFRLAHDLDWGPGKNEVGFSLAASQLENTITHNDGNYWAAGLHAELNQGPWQLQAQSLKYAYKPKNPLGVSNDSILMGSNGLGPAYLVAAKGIIHSLNIGYGIPTPNLGALKKVTLYNDLSLLDKDKSGWHDSKMNTLGVKLDASPFVAWVDLTWAKNANIFDAENNSTGWTSTSSPGSDRWNFRTNINIGYSF